MILPDVDRWAIARALQGLPTQNATGISPIASLLISQWAGRTPTADDLGQARKWFGQDFIQQVFEIDPNGPPPGDAGDVYVPALPRAAQVTGARVTAAAAAGGWLDEWMRWAQIKASMTDPLFLESGGLWLLGLATARRAVLNLEMGPIFNPIYVLWCAGTTYWRKSTGLRAVELVARNTFSHLLLAAQATPEMVMSRLAGNRPANYDDLDYDIRANEDAGLRFAGQRGFISDEVSRLFGAKKYMEGLPELFMELYDCPPIAEQEFKTQGKLLIREPGLSLLFATTPTRLASVFGDGEWEDGLLARFALLTPTRQVVARAPVGRLSEKHQPSPRLIRGLRALYELLPQPIIKNDLDPLAERQSLPTRDVQIDDEALDGFNRYASALHDMTAPTAGLDERLTGAYGRLPIQGLRVAISLALIDWAEAGGNGQPTIAGGHWWRAQQIAEQWRESAHRLLSALNRGADLRHEDRVLSFLRLAHAKPPSRNEIFRGTRIVARKDAYAAVDALFEAGKIVQVTNNNSIGYVLAR